MKKIESKFKANFFKKIFIKICRVLGYEIIDQNQFYVPTLSKKLNENLSIQGKKSIVIPTGEIKITRKITDFTILFRSCTKVNMLTQNKQRLFNKDKIEYTLRSLNSILKSIDKASLAFSKINFKIIVVDHISPHINKELIKKQLNKSKINNEFVDLDINEFKNRINKKNAEGNPVTENQISNMSNIRKSLQIANDQCKDIIYFIEDDYIHEEDSISEMIYTYEKISSLIKKEIILCPADYPYLYSKLDATEIFLGHNKHWRRVGETLVSFLTSKKIVDTYWDKFVSMCEFEHYPFELPLHQIYKEEYCLSPMPSIAMHCTNINSIYGISPNFDWEKAWNDSKNY